MELDGPKGGIALVGLLGCRIKLVFHIKDLVKFFISKILSSGNKLKIAEAQSIEENSKLLAK